MFEGGADGLGRDLVEHHAINVIFGSVFDGRELVGFFRLALGFLFAFFFGLRLGCRAIFAVFAILAGHGGRQHFSQMRADRLALAIGVARQIDGVRLMRGFSQIFHNFRLVRADLVGGLKAVVNIDAQNLFGQIHDVAVRRLDRVITAEIFVDRFRLGRRFDDYQ